MKKWVFFFFLSVCSASLIFTACGDDDDDDGISVNDGCSASWTVDGTNYSEEDMTLCVYLDNTLNLSSSASGGDFQLQINPITTTGTYTADLSNPSVSVVVLLRLNDGTRIGSSNVVVNVTQLSSSKAQGTFSGDFFDIMDFNQTPNFSVTNGVFEANL